MFLGKKEAALAMTECSQSSFGFGRHFSRAVIGRFDGGQMTSDAGALMLRQTDRRINLLSRLAACFRDGRSPWLIQHTVPEMVAQRIYGLALGYEDLSDYDQPTAAGPVVRCTRGKATSGREGAGRQEHPEPAGVKYGA